ncbi:RecQ family ATP-dependent DNA helicase [Halobacillus hunanensis]|uniref:RecQ family ATP-dependent DNA helicase n=1 Tax=Halobacillus hunanensis TaxID=578214 RepID=UPI0009A821C9|nr:RecQ family ATP-dependent DNA helicase [Halobacillus hunanensis]
MRNLDLKEKLYKHFGYRQFRQGQEEIIGKILEGRDVLGILPTGVGKSLCFQLPALLFSGSTVVVSPLISLMVDQVKQMKAGGLKSVIAINSFMDYKEKRKVLEQLDQYSLIYLSPEMLQNKSVMYHLTKMHVDLFVIDEAHCISQWGHEFRTDYLKLSHSIKQVGNPVVLALSATATPEVQTDIKEQLARPEMDAVVYPMDKVNMSFAIEETASHEEKLERITQVLSHNKSPTMIYFSSRMWAERISEELKSRVDQRIAFYHGGMEQMDRLLVQQQFMNDQLDVICCTSAFGMGVDKSNIRRVIHYHFPSELESFIQEIGRAGRDGKPCASLMLYTPGDYHLPQMFIENELVKPEDVEGILHSLYDIVDSQDSILNDEEIAEELKLSETQWNFIKYQLEQEKLVNHHPNITDKHEWTRTAEKIRWILQNRWKYKNRKLQEMVSWLHHPDCKRKKLYSPFQPETRTPEVACCSNCGFRMEDMKLDSEASSVRFTDDWRSRLAKIFHQGDYHATD